MGPEDWTVILTYGVPALAAVGVYVWRRRRSELRTRRALAEARESGLTTPSSLHPWIDPTRCLGCALCVSACPETDVLGLSHGKAIMVKAANCVGHGACKEACPTNAISLVLGTKEEGVEVPALDPHFETNLPGLFVVGELGGMGLIRNAIEQGRQVIDTLQERMDTSDRDRLDVVIIGAGPAGFAASLAAHERGLRYQTLEQDCLGGTVARYPRAKLVLTAPVELPIVGRVDLRETSREALLELWERTERDTGVRIRYGERVRDIRARDGGFEVRSTSGSLLSKAVVLAIGRRGSPRKLGVEGEDDPKVAYQVEDPADFAGRRVLVVGAGDSAIEAATSIAEQPGSQVTLSCRGDGFPRAKPPNRERVLELERSRRLRVARSSRVESVGEDVVLAGPEGREVLAKDAVIVCIGGELPSRFLAQVGVETEVRHGEP
jgi:thioredoxin reductase/NAD-dependent dihydropyrimidine dehydrogenase PreA subunit